VSANYPFASEYKQTMSFQKILNKYREIVFFECVRDNRFEDPNNWAIEVGNLRYILDLLFSIINVSVQTVEIVDGLPGVKFE
jgi:predicted helicase